MYRILIIDDSQTCTRMHRIFGGTGSKNKDSGDMLGFVFSAKEKQLQLNS